MPKTNRYVSGDDDGRYVLEVTSKHYVQNKDSQCDIGAFIFELRQLLLHLEKTHYEAEE